MRGRICPDIGVLVCGVVLCLIASVDLHARSGSLAQIPLMGGEKLRINRDSDQNAMDLPPHLIRPLSVASEPLWAGENLHVLVLWETGEARSDAIPIDSEGFIRYREAGQVEVAGRSILEAQRLLEERLRPYLRHFSVRLHRRDLSEPSVTVVSDLSRWSPDLGEHLWRPDFRLGHLLRSLEGWPPESEEGRITIHRHIDERHERQIVDLNALATDGEGVELRAGDIVDISEGKPPFEVGVFGLVRKPGPQRLAEGVSLSAALESVGGPVPSGTSALWISILSLDGRKTQFPYADLQDRDPVLGHGDVVYLHSRATQR